MSSLHLNVWYEGAKIEVGKCYNPNDIIVYLVRPNKNPKRIPCKDCIINSYQVTQEGLNWYTLTYKINSIELVQEFSVEGIIYKKFIDLDFKVVYIDNDKTEDLTEEFKSSLEFYGHIYMSWYIFLDKVNELKKYGLYIVTIPKMSYLSNQYDMDWEVLCINSETLKASIKKIYNEEEKDNGKENEN